MKGILFDIKRYAIHDGPGIRTTLFFKGCTLNCQWCHNPEGIQAVREIMFCPERCAEECWDCVPCCPRKAIAKRETVISIDSGECDHCGICEDVCAYDAVAVVGREMKIPEVIAEVEKDRIFFDESGGGVTLSGGEPLAQADFSLSLLEVLREREIHTAVDTSGFVPYETLREASLRSDLILYDLKVMDEQKHRVFTGQSNELILDNLRKLSESGSDVIIRVPVVKGLNDDTENTKEMSDFLVSLNRSWQINLLPFHRGGEGKRNRLNKKAPPVEFETPSGKKMQEIKEAFSSQGFHVKIGG